jgi:hypothetical protein
MVVVVVARSIMPRPHRCRQLLTATGANVTHPHPSPPTLSLSSDWATFGAVAVEQSSQRRPL